MSRWLRLRSAARSASAPNLCSSTDLPYIYRQNQAQGDRGGEPDDNEEPAAGKAVKPASDHQGGRQCRDDADADELTQGLRRCGLGAHPWRLQHLYGALETSLSSRTAPFRPSSRRRSSDSSHTGTISAAPSAETPSISSTARRKRALPSSRIAGPSVLRNSRLVRSTRSVQSSRPVRSSRRMSTARTCRIAWSRSLSAAWRNRVLTSAPRPSRSARSALARYRRALAIVSGIAVTCSPTARRSMASSSLKTSSRLSSCCFWQLQPILTLLPCLVLGLICIFWLVVRYGPSAAFPSYCYVP